MAYEAKVNREACFNCGVCMDVCPVRCLDMSRPTARGVEPDGGGAKVWMMEYPAQVDRCTGCNVCVAECPTEAITVRERAGEPEYAQQPRVAHSKAARDLDSWVPLSALTREAFRRVTVDPWGKLHRWKLAADRKGRWQVWRVWTEPLSSEPSQTTAPEKEEVQL